MQRRPMLVTLIVAAFLLASCGSEVTPGTAAPESPDGDDPEPTAQPAEETRTFSVVSNSAGVTEYPMYATIDQLNSEGWDISFYQITAGADVAADGVARGDFATGSGAINVYLAAIQAGAPIEIVAARNVNAWYLYARHSIESCEDLEGVRLAIHSEASSSTALVRQYIAETCPGTEPDYIVIAGSENRFAALIADEVDASPVEVFDGIALDREASDRFYPMVNFAEALPDLYTNSQVFNTSFAEANPTTVTEFLAALLAQYRMIEGNPDYFRELDEAYTEAEPLDDDYLEFYASGFYPTDGGLTEEGLQYIIEYFESQGSIESGLTVEEAADLSYLEAANASLDN